MTIRPLSILLVEDDVAHAEITRRNLQAFDEHVRELVHVTDGQAALDYLHEALLVRLPDLILLDLRLPRVDGLEVLRHIKSDRALKRIPVVVLSTSDAEHDRNGAYERGANAYLVKPVEFDKFVALTAAFGAFWLQSNRYADV